MNLIYFNIVKADMIWLIVFEELLALEASFVMFQSPRKSLECIFLLFSCSFPF